MKLKSLLIALLSASALLIFTNTGFAQSDTHSSLHKHYASKSKQHKDKEKIERKHKKAHIHDHKGNKHAAKKHADEHAGSHSEAHAHHHDYDVAKTHQHAEEH
jgi:hypothetical protein